jgi:hypothetical protein
MDQSPKNPGSAASPSRGRWITALRRAGAVLALVILAGLVARSYLVPAAEVCRDVAGADAGVVRLCGPVGPQDLPALGLFLLLVVVLLLPDFSEVAIPGLVTLKRAVEEQAKRTDSIEARLSIQQTNTTNVYPPDLGKIARDVESRNAELSTRAEAGGTAAQRPPVFLPDGLPITLPSPDRALAEAEILRTWEILQPFLPPRGDAWVALQRRRRDVASPEQLDSAYGDWYYVYREDLETFRTLRNTVVHVPQNLTDKQVREGADLARLLMDSFNRLVPLPERPA